MKSTNTNSLILDRVLTSSSHLLIHGQGNTKHAIQRIQQVHRCKFLDLRTQERPEEIKVLLNNYLRRHKVLCVLIAPESSDAVRVVLSELLEGDFLPAGKTKPSENLQVIAVCPEQADRSISSMIPLSIDVNAALQPSIRAA